MLSTTLRSTTMTSTNLRTFLQLKKVLVRKIHNQVLSYPVQACTLCGHANLYQRNVFRNVRVHSTSTDQHRQKVVIETSTPQLLDGDGKGPLDKLAALRARIEPYAKLARWDKPIGIYLLYWPCAWSLALGALQGAPPPAALHAAALFLAGAGLMRGAGCTINDLWDRDLDRQVERTKDRPLVSGAVTSQQAVAFLALQLSGALAILLHLNCYSVVLGASSMLLVITYPLAKRFTNYPQLFLGATFNWGALLGYSALTGGLNLEVCVPLYLASVLWTVIYDTIYAHQDKVDDARVGIKSTALTFGPHTKPVLGGCLSASAGLLAAAGAAAGLGAPYYAAVAGYVAHAASQIYTLNTDCPDDCAKKFKSNSLIGLIIFLGILGGGYQQYLDNLKSGKKYDDVTSSCVFG